MKKAVIFDLDGTLSDTINSIAFFANSALAKYGLRTIDVERFKMFVGDGARTLVERVMAEVGCDDTNIFKKVLEDYNTTYDSDFLYLTRVYDGISELLTELKKRGVKLAVLSNKPHSTTVQVLSALFPSGTFDVFFGGRDGVPLKPNPQAVLEIIELLGVTKDECIYIGDTATDMKTAKNAELFAVGVLWGFRDEPELRGAHADVIIKEPSEILELI